MLFIVRITQKYDNKDLIYMKLKNTAKQNVFTTNFAKK